MMMTKNFSTFFDRCMRLDQNFSNVEPRERIFLFQSRLLCNSNYSSLSFPLSLPPSPSLHHKIRENWIRRQLQLFGQKTAPTELSQFTQSSLMPFGFRPLRTIRTKHEWMRVLVFLFSALPPSFFVTLTTEAEWRGVSAGEHIKSHSGNTRKYSPAILVKTTKLLPAWITTLSQNRPFAGQNSPFFQWTKRYSFLEQYSKNTRSSSPAIKFVEDNQA